MEDVFRRFVYRAMTNYGIKIKHVRSDNGTKFKNTSLDVGVLGTGVPKLACLQPTLWLS